MVITKQIFEIYKLLYSLLAMQQNDIAKSHFWNRFCIIWLSKECPNFLVLKIFYLFFLEQITTQNSLPERISPTLSRHNTNSTDVNTSFDLSATSRVSTNMPVTSYLFTEKDSVPTGELHKLTDSEQRSAVCTPSATIKPAEEGHNNVPIVTIENDTIHQPASSYSGDKFVSSSSVIVHDSNTGTTAAVKDDKFATNEKLLQLHLKSQKFPYRTLRCDVETDLETGLQAYFELDVLDEDNKFICDVCTALRIEEQGKAMSYAVFDVLQQLMPFKIIYFCYRVCNQSSWIM